MTIFENNNAHTLPEKNSKPSTFEVSNDSDSSDCCIYQLPIPLLKKIINQLPGTCLFLCLKSARRFHESQNDVGFWNDRIQSEFGTLDCFPTGKNQSVSASKRVYAHMLMWRDAMDTFHLLKRLGVPGDIDGVVIDGTCLDRDVLRALAHTTALTAPSAADIGAPNLGKLRSASMLPLAILAHSRRRDLRDRAAAALANVVARGPPLAVARP